MRISDWSSDVCSSDLLQGAGGARAADASAAFDRRALAHARADRRGDRKSVVLGKRVSVRVDRGGRRIIKKKKNIHQMYIRHIRTTLSVQSITYNMMLHIHQLLFVLFTNVCAHH